MTVADYRYMATEIRDLIPLLVHPRAAADLRLLAERYERFAHHLEMGPVNSRPRLSTARAKRADAH